MELNEAVGLLVRNIVHDPAKGDHADDPCGNDPMQSNRHHRITLLLWEGGVGHAMILAGSARRSAPYGEDNGTVAPTV